MIDEKKLILSIEQNLVCIGDEKERKIVEDTITCIKQIIEVQPKIGEWYPVKLFDEKLPTKDGRYLVTLDDGFAATTDLVDGEWELWADSGEVIAWMPLPKPYERNEDE